MVDRLLLYHLYPRKGEMWKWNIDAMKPYIGMFDSAAVHVSYDATTEDLAYVAEYLNRWNIRIEVSTSPNNPVLGECVGFEKLVATARRHNPRWVFYAHAKGVSHRPEDLDVLRFWTAFMLHSNLSDDQHITELMTEYATIGACRTMGNFRVVSPKHRWHYSGTFYWMQWSVLATQNLTPLLVRRHSVEELPGNLLPLDYSACTLLDNIKHPPAYSSVRWRYELDKHRISDSHIRSLREKYLNAETGSVVRQLKRFELLQSGDCG